MKKFLIALTSVVAMVATTLPIWAEVIVAEDFRYAQPTKLFGPGGGFTRQDYGGGHNGLGGQWLGRWVSVGDGIITGTDISEEAFNLETDVFTGATRNGLSVNWLERDFAFSGLDNEQTIFFGVTMRSSSETAQPNSTFFINDAGGNAAIGMGYTEAGFRALLGNPDDSGAVDIVPGPQLTDGLDPHRLIGKLELNARGNDERLTVWLDPTDVETAEEMTRAEADVVSGLSELDGNLRLDHVGSGGIMFWDDVAVGTSWESVANVQVPRATLLADPEDDQVRWKNETGGDLDVMFLQLESERSLLERNWSSLSDREVPGWAENNPERNRLTESNFQGSLAFQDGTSFTWGEVYRGTREDLIAHIGTTNGLLNIADIVYGPIPPEAPTTDFDGNGVTDVLDIDALCLQVASGENSSDFDLTDDGAVNADDLGQFLNEVGTIAGDANLDKMIDFPDFLALSTNFGQEERTWSHGNFDCTGTVDFADFLELSTNFGKTFGAETAAVPEPSAFMIALVASCGLWRWRKWR